MNVLETIVVIIVIIMIGMTWLSEPKISLDYTKAFIHSGNVVAKKVISVFKGFKTNESSDNHFDDDKGS